MIILDSTFLIALLNTSDPSHNKAVGEMRKYEAQEKTFVVNEPVLGKVASVINSEVGPEKAAIFVDYALENYKIHENEEDDIAAISNIMKNQKNKISYSDASLIYLSKFLNCPIATFNGNLQAELKNYKNLK
ncbi:MAG: type II toxin-antitoxin system VapC family toxin [Candidatus Micrarchaeota archaeon]